MKFLYTLTPKQKKAAIAGGVGGFLILALAIWFVLWLNRSVTIQTRMAQTSSVTVSLVEKKAEVPPSWQGEKPATEPPVEQAPPQPEAMPPAIEKEEISAESELPVTKEEPTPPPAPEVTAETKPAAEAIQVTKPAEQQKPEVEVATPEEAAPAPAVEPPVARAPVDASMPLWKKYARPFDLADVRPRIALIVVDMGMAAASTQSGIQDMPGAVTLAFSALAPNLESDMLKARAAGHEMLLAVPMEPNNYPQNDAGPNSLLVALQDADNVSRLNRALSRSDGYVGIIPVMGEKFVTFEKKLSPIIDTLRKESLMIVDSTMAGASMIPPLARLVKIPFARADIMIDSAARTAIDAQLATVEALAQERGQVTVIIKPYPVTFEKLTDWIATLDAKNMILAPVSAVTSMSQPPAPTEASDTMSPADQAAEPQVEAPTQ